MREHLTGRSLPAPRSCTGWTRGQSFSAFLSSSPPPCARDAWLGYALLLAVTAAVVAVCGLPLRTALASVARMGWFFLLIFVMNALFFATDDAIWHWWILTLSVPGIVQGAQVTVRLALILVMSNVLTCTTPPLEITGAIQTLLSPLRLVRLPVEDIAMILSVAVQFIPTLLEETDTIRKAQIARGARFESRHLHERAQAHAAADRADLPQRLQACRRARHGHGGARLPRRARPHPKKVRSPAPERLGRACAVRPCVRSGNTPVNSKSERNRSPMQTMSTVKKSIITAVCIALCYVLPLLFHGIQGAGQIFCPMHIPVFLCGLVCGWQFGLLCGLAGPALSSALCGMPPVSILPSMMIELAVYGLIAGIMMRCVRTRHVYARPLHQPHRRHRRRPRCQWPGQCAHLRARQLLHGHVGRGLRRQELAGHRHPARVHPEHRVRAHEGTPHPRALPEGGACR